MKTPKFLSILTFMIVLGLVGCESDVDKGKLNIYDTIWYAVSSSEDFSYVEFCKNGTVNIQFSSSRQAYKWSARNGKFTVSYQNGSDVPNLQYSFEASYYAYGETTPKWITFEGEANITKKSDGTYTIFMAPSIYISGIGSIQFVSTLKLNMGNSTEDNGKLSIANTYWTSDGDDFKSVTFKKDGTMDIVFSNSRQSYKWSARRGKYSCTYPNDTELPTVKYSFEASYYAYGETTPKWITFESEATVRKSSDGSYTIFMAPSKYVSGVGNLQFISTLKMVR